MINLSGILDKRHTSAIGAIVDEVIANSGEKVALRLMPMKNLFAKYVEHEIVAGYGGLTNERLLGESGKQIAGLSSKNRVFEVGSYQENILFTEKDLIHLRKLGTYGDRGATGMTNGELDHISKAATKLKVRIENRIQKLIWDAIFTGKYTYQGVEYNFDIPAQNTIDATTDWTDVANSNPYGDLIQILEQNAILRKYKFAEIVMNGTTAANILRSNAVKTYLTNANIKNATIDEVKEFIAPGLPKFTVVKDSYQDESIVNGKVVLGNAEYFVPDNKLLLVPDFSNSEYGQLGDFELGENLNDPSATLDKPAVGTYVFADEKGLENKANPHMKVIGGFNGAPNLKRSNDVFVIEVD